MLFLANIRSQNEIVHLLGTIFCTIVYLQHQDSVNMNASILPYITCHLADTFIQSDIHFVHSTSMKEHLGIQYLAQGHFGMQMGKMIEPPTFWFGGRPLYPSATYELRWPCL